MKAFFDTNMLVYLFDAGVPAKQRRAREVLTTHLIVSLSIKLSLAAALASRSGATVLAFSM